MKTAKTTNKSHMDYNNNNVTNNQNNKKGEKQSQSQSNIENNIPHSPLSDSLSKISCSVVDGDTFIRTLGCPQTVQFGLRKYSCVPMNAPSSPLYLRMRKELDEKVQS
jgi:hypothetical protein